MANGKKGKKGKQKAGLSKKGVEKIARQTMYRQIPRKIMYNQVTDQAVQTNGSPWVIIQPTFIDAGDQNHNRRGDSVFIEKCSGFFNLSMSTHTLNRVEVRELCGFYKGSTNESDKNIANFGTHELNTILPNKMSAWDRDNFLIKHDKSYDLVPQHMYDNQGTPLAVWRSKRIPLSLYLFRKFRYTNTVQGGSGNTVEGSLAASNYTEGWKPFIALQVRCPEQNFTGTTGNNAGPYLDYKFITSFKDLI